MHYAAKLLSSSDLTLFASYFRSHSTSKQKGTNLNGDILAGKLFPALPSEIVGTFEQSVELDIYGPGGASIHKVRRKIIKPQAGKNWRLNGKLIEAPSIDTSRFDHLEAGDIAVFGFDGEPLPTSVSMVILSATAPVDQAAWKYFQSVHGLTARTRSMVELTASDLAGAPISEGHPLRLLLPDPLRTADIVAAAEDDEEAGNRLAKRAASGLARPVSAAELAAARARAQEIGRAGEALFCAHLETELTEGRVTSFVWAADLNATSPYDFSIVLSDGSQMLIDVKTTGNHFQATIHLSAAELETAALHSNYRLARVFDISAEEGPKLRLSEPIGDIAKGIVQALTALPNGVRASKLEIKPDVFAWGEFQALSPEED